MVYRAGKGDLPALSYAADLFHESLRFATKRMKCHQSCNQSVVLSPIRLFCHQSAAFCPQSCHQSVTNRVTNCSEALMLIANHFIGKIRVA